MGWWEKQQPYFSPGTKARHTGIRIYRNMSTLVVHCTYSAVLHNVIPEVLTQRVWSGYFCGLGAKTCSVTLTLGQSQSHRYRACCLPDYREEKRAVIFHAGTAAFQLAAHLRNHNKPSMIVAETVRETTQQNQFLWRRVSCTFLILLLLKIKAFSS